MNPETRLLRAILELRKARDRATGPDLLAPGDRATGAAPARPRPGPTPPPTNKPRTSRTRSGSKSRHKIFDRIDDAVRWLELMGFTVEQGGSGHLKVYHRERMVGVISKNMNDARGWKNAMRHIQRVSGVVLR